MRKETGRTGIGTALGALAAFTMLAVSAQAQQAEERGRWLPWLGCWEAVGEPARPVAATSALCVVDRAGAAGVELLTIADGQIASRRVLAADGQQRTVEQSGCAGWERASWSADGQRVYLRSELTCEGGARRLTSGVLTMASPTEWLDLQSVEAGGYPVVRMRRYRQAPDAVAERLGIEAPQGVALALETARTAAAQPLSVEDVAEASKELASGTLEMLLFERGGLFEVNADALVALDEAGVDPNVIDLVVALAYPDVFGVNSGARTVGFRPDEPTSQELADARSPRVYGTFYDPWGPFGYGYGGYGYGYGSRYGSYYSPFGWGNPYGWRQTGGGSVIIIQPPDDVGGGNGPVRYVKGRGYTRGSSGESTRSSSPPRRDVSTVGRSGSSGASSTSSAGSSSTGSSSTGRTAKRRTGGGGG